MAFPEHLAEPADLYIRDEPAEDIDQVPYEAQLDWIYDHVQDIVDHFGDEILSWYNKEILGG